MPSIHSAVIYSPSFTEGQRQLLNRDIAGIGLFKRLVLTLQRAGLHKIVILSGDIPEKDCSRMEKDIHNDSRFKAKMLFVNQENLEKQEGRDRIDEFISGPGFLLTGINMITNARLIHEFLDAAQKSGSLDRGKIAALQASSKETGGMYLLPAEKLKVLQNYSRNPGFEESVEPIHLKGPGLFWEEVEDAGSARSAEAELIKSHRYSYTQFMDIWFNSFLSAPISSFLVKTPATPNQVTLFGLVIGLMAGWCFSLGNHFGEIVGALFLVATAVWDCCDGEVARLKFMESDFGETLDTACDNIINVFIFTGMGIGVAKQYGMAYAAIPFFLLALGGGLIFYLIYFPKEGKGSFFKGTWAYKAIQILASRNFIYIIFLFAVFGRLDAFLWLAGFGSMIFALALYVTKQNIHRIGEDAPGS